MPVKRRMAKGRSFDELKVEDQLYGPGTCLFNGCGYLGSHGDGLWRDKSPEVKAAVLDEMRIDWTLHHRTIMAAWANRTDHEKRMADEYHGAPVQPWALTEFGEP